MAWDAGSIESRLDVDTSPFHRGLEEAKAEAREFADKRYTTTVDINTKRSQDELAAVESRLHSIESTMDRISTKGGGGSGGGRGGLLSRFAGANIPHPSLMTLGLGAALPLAAPFAGLAGGIAGGAASAGATGLLGLGAFGAGAKSSVGTITKDVAALDKLTKQYDAATTNKQRAAVLSKEAALWKGLDPLQRQAVKNVQGLEGAWHGYQKALEPQTFKLVADGSKLAETGLKYLLPTAKAVGGELDRLTRDARKNFTDPFWKQFFGDFLPGEAVKSVDTLGRVLGNFLTGGAHLIQDFAPLAHDLDGSLLSLSGKFEKWSEGAGPGKFVAWAEKNGPPAAKALEALAKAIGNLAVGFAPLGAIELKLLTPAINAVGDFSKAHPKVIRDVGLALLTVGAGLKAISLAQGAAGILSKIPGLGGKIPGGGGSGGGRGGLLDRGSSPTNPLYVWVVDQTKGGGLGLPGGKGGAAKTVEKDVEKYGPGALPWLSKIPVLGKLFGGLTGAGIAFTGGTVTDKLGPATEKVPGAGHGGVALSVRGDMPQKVKDLLAQVNEITRANKGAAASFAALGTNVSTKKLEEWVRMWSGGTHQVGQDVDTLNAKNTGAIKKMEAGEAAFEAAHRRAVNNVVAQLKRIPGAYQQVAAEAKAGGMTIGQELDAGLTIGIKQGGGKVMFVTKQMVDGVLHVAHVTAQAESPSRVTIQLGKWIAEGLAVGFTGYSATLLAKVGKATGGMLNHLGVQLNNAANQYRSDLQARADSSASIAQGIMGSASITNVVGSNTGGASIGGFLGGQISADRTFAARLAALRKRGLDPRLLQQLVDAGPQQGGALAQQILAGSQGYIRGLNAQERTLSSLSTSIGGTVAGANFAGPLARDQKSLDRAAAALEKIVGERLHLDRTDMQQMARDFAHEFVRVFPTLNLTTLNHALGIQIVGG